MAAVRTEYVQLLFIALAIYVIYVMFFRETFEQTEEPQPEEQAQPQPEEPKQEMPKNDLAPEQPMQPVEALIQENPQLTADELLPKYDEANEFAQQNPVSELLKEQNFLISGYHMGINTVMQSNKIPFHDLRAAPPIPKENLGPFLNSSYETPAGTNRRSLEII